MDIVWDQALPASSAASSSSSSTESPALNLEQQQQRNAALKRDLVVWEGDHAGRQALSAQLCAHLDFYPPLNGLELLRCATDELPIDVLAQMNLVSLSLSSLPNLRELPEAISNIVNLDALFITEVPLTHLPDSIRELPLTTLSLRDIPPTAMTAENVGQLATLHQLSLHNCGLTEVPSWIDRNHFPQLQHLQLGLNQISEIPPALLDLGAVGDRTLIEIEANPLDDERMQFFQNAREQHCGPLPLFDFDLSSMPGTMHKEWLAAWAKIDPRRDEALTVEVQRYMQRWQRYCVANLPTAIRQLHENLGDASDSDSSDIDFDQAAPRIADSAEPHEPRLANPLYSHEPADSAVDDSDSDADSDADLWTLVITESDTDELPMALLAKLGIQFLDLDNLSNLRELPPEIKLMPQLRILSLNSLDLGCLPQELWACALRNLKFQDMLLPEVSIDSVQQQDGMEQLTIKACGLTEVPAWITAANFPSLGELKLASNDITHIPDELLGVGANAPRTRIHMTANPLQAGEVARWQALAETRRLAGQVTAYLVMGEEVSVRAEQDLAIAVSKWRERSQLTANSQSNARWSRFANEPGAQGFSKLLTDLCATQEFSDLELRPTLQARVNSILEDIEQSPEHEVLGEDFRAKCFAVCSFDASCHDMPLELLSELERVRLNYHALSGRLTPAGLLNAGLGEFRMRILEKPLTRIVNNRLNEGEDTDPVQMWLGLLVALGEPLQLPTHAQSTLYASTLTNDEITAAFHEVRRAETENNGEAAIKFLAEWDPWCKYLERSAPQVEEHREAYKAQRQALSDSAENNEINQGEWLQADREIKKNEKASEAALMLALTRPAKTALETASHNDTPPVTASSSSLTHQSHSADFKMDDDDISAITPDLAPSSSSFFDHQLDPFANATLSTTRPGAKRTLDESQVQALPSSIADVEPTRQEDSDDDDDIPSIKKQRTEGTDGASP